MPAYYNEHDKFAAAWLRELIKANLIAPGEVDERSITDVQPRELAGFTQCHFFAGIGVWSYALRAAGWADDTPVWTGSCPCQSFSASGKRGGFSDERHLWPAWFRLIRECKPDTVFGEQVASKDGLAWFDIVSSDMEGEGYTIGAADTCAAGFGAPIQSQRLYFVAQAERAEVLSRFGEVRSRTRQDGTDGHGNSGIVVGLAASSGERCGEERTDSGRPTERYADSSEHGCMGAAHAEGLAFGPWTEERFRAIREQGYAIAQAGLMCGFWRGADWVLRRARRDPYYEWCPVECCSFPLGDGLANRVGRLRGYGNALNAEQAKGFIEAYMETDGRVAAPKQVSLISE